MLLRCATSPYFQTLQLFLSMLGSHWQVCAWHPSMCQHIFIHVGAIHCADAAHCGLLLLYSGSTKPFIFICSSSPLLILPICYRIKYVSVGWRIEAAAHLYVLFINQSISHALFPIYNRARYHLVLSVFQLLQCRSKTFRQAWAKI